MFKQKRVGSASLCSASRTLLIQPAVGFIESRSSTRWINLHDLARRITFSQESFVNHHEGRLAQGCVSDTEENAYEDTTAFSMNHEGCHLWPPKTLP